MDGRRKAAMNMLGLGLYEGQHYEDAVSVKEALLSLMRRLGGSAHDMLVLQSNLATMHSMLGRSEDCIRIERDVYSGRVKLHGEDSIETLGAANNYAQSLNHHRRFEEARSLLRKVIPVARRVLGKRHEYTLTLTWNYAEALYKDDGATLDDLREAVETLEDVERIARRVFGPSHPSAVQIEIELQAARAALQAATLELEK